MLTVTVVVPNSLSRLTKRDLKVFFEKHEPRFTGMPEQIPLPTAHVQLRDGYWSTNNFARQSLFVGFERSHVTPFISVHLEREPESSQLAVALVRDQGLGVDFLYRNSNVRKFGLSEVPYEAEISRCCLDNIPEILADLANKVDRAENISILVNGKLAAYGDVYEAYGGKGSGSPDGPTLFYYGSVLTLKAALANDLMD